MEPPNVRPSGAVDFMPQQHTLCGICNGPFLLCPCEGLTPQCDYILVGLPPPPANSTFLQLVKRWTSLTSMSMSMGGFNGDQWYSDNSASLWTAVQQRSESLNQMVEDYVSSLPADPKLSLLAKAVGKQKGTTADKAQAVASETRAAMAAFQSGDWACVTFVGSILIQNAFQSSDPQRYSLSDEHLKTVFENGVGLLNGILNMGYDGRGHLLALENGRPPFGTDLESAATRLA